MDEEVVYILNITRGGLEKLVGKDSNPLSWSDLQQQLRKALLAVRAESETQKELDTVRRNWEACQIERDEARTELQKLRDALSIFKATTDNILATE